MASFRSAGGQSRGQRGWPWRAWRRRVQLRGACRPRRPGHPGTSEWTQGRTVSSFGGATQRRAGPSPTARAICLSALSSVRSWLAAASPPRARPPGGGGGPQARGEEARAPDGVRQTAAALPLPRGVAPAHRELPTAAAHTPSQIALRHAPPVTPGSASALCLTRACAVLPPLCPSKGAGCGAALPPA